MSRLLWVIGYAYRAARSPYQISFAEALGEGWASWDALQHECIHFGEPMPTPAEALYDDQTEWSQR